MSPKEIGAVIHAPYFLHPRPDLAGEIIRSYRSGDNIGQKTMILSLLEAHPDHAEAWVKELEFSYYVKHARRVLENASITNPGWNDHYMCRWLILGDRKAIPEIIRRTTLMGQVGDLARWMVKSVREQIPEFDQALHNEGNKDANVAKVIYHPKDAAKGQRRVDRANALVGTPFIPLPGITDHKAILFTSSNGTPVPAEAVEMVFNDALLMDAISDWGKDGPLIKDTYDTDFKREVYEYAQKAYAGVEIPEKLRRPT